MPLNRRQVLGSTLSWAVSAQTRAKLPNIVLILADDLGYGDIAAYNPESKIPTPEVDRLAREGVRFLDAHTPCGVCSPTRYSLLTGRYPWRSELKRQVLWPYDKPLIDPARLTLPQMLQSRGYRTACFGKWHLGWEWSTTDGSRVNDQVKIGDPQRPIREEFAKKVRFEEPVREGPTARGFDYYFGVDVPNFPPYTFLENDRLLGKPTEDKPEAMFGWPGKMEPGWKLEGVLPEITRRAVQWVEAATRRPEPFFVYLPLTGPHTPIAPAGEFLGKSRAGRYGDFVHQVDASVGRVVEALRRTGADKNTLVIFTSDNGPENLTYAVQQEFGHQSQGPLRGGKRMLWEGGHRVPFIAWGKGVKPGTTEGEVVCLTDLMATVGKLVNYPLPAEAGEDSYDIGDALFGRPRRGPIREATVHHSVNDEYGLRQGDWVLIESAKGEHGAGEPKWWREKFQVEPHAEPAELFNLREDPRELRNLYAREPERVRAMRALLAKYKQDGRSVPVAGRPAGRPGR
jgi:arylsulfatase A